MLIDVLQVIAKKMAGRRTVPPVPPGLFVVIASDEAEEAFDPGPRKISLTLFIEYRDARGQASQRRITCRRFEASSDTVLAYCFERRAYRRFKMSGIVSAACPETGEVYDLTELRARFAGGSSVEEGEGLRHYLTVLVFLMRCDREAHPLEREAIEDAVGAYALRHDGDDNMVLVGVKIARSMAPDIEEFIAALEWIGEQPDRALLARLIGRQAEAVVMADGYIASEEAYFWGNLRDALAEMV